MRRLVLVLFAASTLISCKESETPAVQPDKQDETAKSDEKTLPTSAPPKEAAAPRPTLNVAAEPAPSSPFLVAPTATQVATTEAIRQDPPPLPPPPPPAPPPGPRTWGTTTANNTGKPCPQGQCQLANGRCVIPGGPIAHENDPPGVVSGVCGGNGGPCSPCRCVALGTSLSTPRGEIAIEDLRTKDLVWSMHQGRVQAVRILATQRVHVQNHSMARLQLSDGFVVEMSGEHPTGDGRNLWDLQPGETLGKGQIEALSIVPYGESFTYDVLPDSDTGTYFVHGLWIGSTMFGLHVRGDIVEATK